MTVSQLTAALESVGATPEQAEDLAEVMHLTTWHAIPRKHGPLSAEDRNTMKQWLDAWIMDKQDQAVIVRKIRQQHKDAGYFGIPPEAPVRLNGRAKW